MADLTTTWLGLVLPSPLVVAASPLSNDIEVVAQLVSAGAGAIVMHSLFEEQVIAEQMGAHRFMDMTIDRDAEARSFLPDTDVFALGTEPYLKQLEKLRERFPVPIIASLNGASPGGWTEYAQQLESRGASAIELNLYTVATNPDLSGADAEAQQLAVVASVVKQVSIPVSVKLSPFYASLPGFARQLAAIGVKGITVFNRFYQPDIDLDRLDVDLRLELSSPSDLPLRLHALAILYPQATLDLACSGGVHSGHDAAKAILAGARVVQVASALLANGPDHMAIIRSELEGWLDGKGYQSSAEACGVMSLKSAPDPKQWERLNYVRVLEGWKPRAYRGSRS